MTNDSCGLRISIVTPSFNQAPFLRACLDSVRAQTRPAVEHLVFDPGSSDGGRDIARSYPGVTLFEEPDEGQADAVGKGFSRAKGDIIGWLNSDDEYYDEHVFQAICERFSADDRPEIVYGRAVWTDEAGRETGPVWMNDAPERLFDAFQESVGIAQPALFLRRHVVEKIGLPDKRLHFALDYEYWIRAAQADIRFAFLDRPLAKLRYYPTNKTAGRRGDSYREVCKVVKEKYGYVSIKWLKRYAEFNLTGVDGIAVPVDSQIPKPPSDQENNRHAGIYNLFRRLHPYPGLNRSDSSPPRPELTGEIDRLAAVYNLDKRAIDILRTRADREPYRSTYRYLQKLTEFVTPPWREIAAERRTLPGHQCYTVGEHRFAFDVDWLDRQLERTRGAIDYFRKTRRSDTCILVGNGPSLNRVDFELLYNQDVFAANYAFLHRDLVDKIRFLSVVNYTVAEQGSFEFQSNTDAMILLPYWLRYAIHEADNVFFFTSVGFPEFSTDLNENVSWRSTVTFFNMQLAYGFGYRKVLMVGFDHSYVQSSNLNEGDLIEQTTDDVNHFSPYYFYKKEWQAADTELMEQMYRLAKDAFEVDGREIVNCTVGGQLEIFRRSTLESELAGDWRPRGRV